MSDSVYNKFFQGTVVPETWVKQAWACRRGVNEIMVPDRKKYGMEMVPYEGDKLHVDWNNDFKIHRIQIFHIPCVDPKQKMIEYMNNVYRGFWEFCNYFWEKRNVMHGNGMIGNVHNHILVGKLNRHVYLLRLCRFDNPIPYGIGMTFHIQIFSKNMEGWNDFEYYMRSADVDGNFTTKCKELFGVSTPVMDPEIKNQACQFSCSNCGKFILPAM